MTLHRSIEDWQAASREQRERAARSLALPQGFEFHALRGFECGAMAFEIAQFRYGGTMFSLVPGAAATLGFDGERWEPSAEMHDSWNETAEEYEIDEGLVEHAVANTTPVRQCRFGPMLVECEYREVGWRAVDRDSPRVVEALRQYPRGVRQMGDPALRVRVSDDGRVDADEADPAQDSSAGVAAALARDGFRLPSPDEWEYLCGASSRELFRWGPHVRCDRYPTDVSPEESVWRRLWPWSGGAQQPSRASGAKGLWLHRQANAFGLRIAFDPYKVELTDDPAITRGGDGGMTICGGSGFMAGWLALASAWTDQIQAAETDPEGGKIYLGYTVARRVVPLD